jgi:hypothetical protein
VIRWEGIGIISTDILPLDYPTRCCHPGSSAIHLEARTVFHDVRIRILKIMLRNAHDRFHRFGSPSHRLEAQIQATARVLELNCQVVYLPGTCLVSFGDDATHTSETKFLKQATGLDLQKLLATHHVYWDVSIWRE